jgi:copper chaperone NosL
VHRSRTLRSAVVLVAWLLAACTRVPQPIQYGRDACDYCRMQISDPRYGAELVTAKGKVHTFDSIECLAAYYLAGDDRATTRSVWVSDFARPGTLVPGETAHYLRAAGPSSPMGKGLMAFSSTADTAALHRSYGEVPLRWIDVLALVEREGLRQGAGGGDAAAHAR